MLDIAPHDFDFEDQSQRSDIGSIRGWLDTLLDDWRPRPRGNLGYGVAK